MENNQSSCCEQCQSKQEEIHRLEYMLTSLSTELAEKIRESTSLQMNVSALQDRLSMLETANPSPSNAAGAGNSSNRHSQTARSSLIMGGGGGGGGGGGLSGAEASSLRELVEACTRDSVAASQELAKSLKKNQELEFECSLLRAKVADGDSLRQKLAAAEEALILALQGAERVEKIVNWLETDRNRILFELKQVREAILMKNGDDNNNIDFVDDEREWVTKVISALITRSQMLEKQSEEQAQVIAAIMHGADPIAATAGGAMMNNVSAHVWLKLASRKAVEAKTEAENREIEREKFFGKK